MQFSLIVKLKEKTFFIVKNFLKETIYKMRYGLAKGLKRKGGLGFLPRRSPPSNEEKFLLNLQFKNMVVYDIGGFEGIFTIFFARAVGQAGRVLTFEPNPLNLEVIRNNVAINHFRNVTIFPIGVGKEKVQTTMSFDPNSTATGSLNPHIRNYIQQQKGTLTIPIKVDAIDNLFKQHHLPPPDFVKIDVEGMELDVLTGITNILEKFKPKLFIEIHGLNEQKKLQNVQEIVNFLTNKKYLLFHVESNSLITSQNSNVAKEGHLFVFRELTEIPAQNKTN